jgi:hypothetical protein
MLRDRSLNNGPIFVALLLITGMVSCGDGGTGTDDGEPAVVEIANNTLSFAEPAETAQLDVTVRDGAGNVLSDVELTFATDNEGVAAVSTAGVVQGLGDGEAEITVTAGSASAAASVTVEIAVVMLELDEPEAGLDGPTLGQRYFTVDVPPGEENRVLLVRLKGGTGDADMAIRLGSRPAEGNVDCVSATDPNVIDNIEFCAVMSPEPGTWHVSVVGYAAYEDVTLRATLEPVTPLVADTPLEALAAAEHELLFFAFDVPEGSAFDLAAAGGDGDADIFATSAGVVAFNDVGGLPCVSAGPGNDESCTVGAPDPGPWMTFVLAFEAFDGLTLTADLDGAD